MSVSRIGLAFVIVVGLAGCKSCDDNGSGAGPTSSASSSTTTPSASVTGQASASASSGRPDRRTMRFGGGGPVGALFSAADEADLKPEQKTKVEEIKKGLHTDGDSSREEAKGFREELEAQVKVGKIDMAKLEPHLAAIEKASKERLEKDDDALNKLYAALEPAQRTAVAAKVKAKQGEREAKLAKRPLQARAGGSQIARMTKNLDLDDAQKKKVDALAAKHEPDGGAPHAMAGMMANDKRMTALANAFEKDGFDAKKVEPVDAKKARAPFEAQAKLFSELLPILQPPQREKLASAMDRGGGHGSGRHGNHGDGKKGGHGGGDGDGDDDDDK